VRKQPPQGAATLIDVRTPTDVCDEGSCHKLAVATSGTMANERRNSELSKFVRTI